MNALREFLIAALLGALLPILVFALGPIAQPASYHDLADQRPILGISHFWNVASNLPFLVIGAMGLHLLWRQREEAAGAWRTVFAGTALVAFGSSWYHSDPNDATLVWDRLPIGMAFMGFFTALLIEHFSGASKRAAQRLLVPWVAFSAAAIWWWYVVAKLFEVADLQVMHWTGGLMSGHAMKHLAAAAGVWCFYVMLRQRSTIGDKSWTSASPSYGISR